MAKSSNKNTAPPTQLSRSLTLFPTTAIVIGSVVGSGIFVSSAGMARALGSGSLMLTVWALGGLMTLFGALTLCELAAQMPRTGGLYEYLKEIYGEPVGFLYGWANLVIAGSGSIAAIAFVFSNYIGEFVALPRLDAQWEAVGVHLPMLGTLFPFADLGTKSVGALLIAGLTYLNVRGVKLGATVQSISTTAKILALLAIVAVAFLYGGHVGSVSNLWSTTPKGELLNGWTMMGAICVALSGAFWSYDGWGNVAFIAEEVKNPQRNVPRAIVMGTLAFTGVYLLVNLAYLYIMPIAAIGDVPRDRVASSMVSAVFGNAGGGLVAMLVILSTFDTVNASILTNGRVYFAMARSNMFWQKVGAIHPRYQTPHVSLWIQGAWSLVLLMSGSFDLIASMYVFVNWGIYVLMALGVFILRFRSPNAERPFRVPGYPLVPGIFVLFSMVYVVMTLVTDIQAYRAGEEPVVKSLMGLVLVGFGLPLFFYWKRSRARR